ncbi:MULTISPECIES: tryptophan synthase subunit alpha [unclassified Salinibacterium]|uniref:tryptophan synthase subunit alpha n=1 Tax=unclassified Salinibacterium TaxID=2632331 RepID=UPI00141DDC6C|nr:MULTISPECIES: tryptophan synthase subunit alpha [unclassified Salinibacterium]
MSTAVHSVEERIQARKAEGKGSFVGYLPVGFPNLPTSIDAAVALAENGADVLELGVPYSDPVMDGLVIQQATRSALSGGFRLRDVFTAVEQIRARVDVPVLVMTYWNPVLQFGVDRFADALVSAGGSGLITPDITPDSADDWIATSERTGLDRVFLAAPTSTDERLKRTVEATRGFVYAVSTMGITGLRTDLDAAARTLVARLHDAGSTTTCVGIGISTADQVSQVLEYADGAIVGTALVKALADDGIPGLVRTAQTLSAGK